MSFSLVDKISTTSGTSEEGSLTNNVDAVEFVCCVCNIDREDIGGRLS